MRAVGYDSRHRKYEVQVYDQGSPRKQSECFEGLTVSHFGTYITAFPIMESICYVCTPDSLMSH